MLVKVKSTADPRLICSRALSLVWPVNAVKGERFPRLYSLLMFSTDCIIGHSFDGSPHADRSTLITPFSSQQPPL